MKNILKKIGVFLILPVIFLLTTIFVSAIPASSITLELPVSNEVIEKVYNFSVTAPNETSYDGTAVELVNVTIYGYSTSTVNSTAVIFLTISNTSTNAESDGGFGPNMTRFNATFDTQNEGVNEDMGFEDAANWVFYAIFNSGPDANTSTSATAVRVDNSVTVAATSLSPTTGTVDTDGSVTFSGTVIGANTTACNLYFPNGNPGSSNYSMTHSGNTCTKTLTVPEQSYDWYIFSTDETNVSNTAILQLRVDIKTSAGKAAMMKAQLGEKAKVTGPHLLTITQEKAFDFMTSKIGGVPVILIFILAAAFLIYTFRKKK